MAGNVYRGSQKNAYEGMCWWGDCSLVLGTQVQRSGPSVFGAAAAMALVPRCRGPDKPENGGAGRTTTIITTTSSEKDGHCSCLFLFVPGLYSTSNPQVIESTF